MTAPLPDVVLDEAAARELTARIRAHLQAATVDLIDAWTGRVWIPLGHASWQAYLDAEFGDLLHIRLPVTERRDRVAAMRSQGMSARAIAPALGVSVGTIGGDLKAPEVAERVQLAQVISLDDRRRPAQGCAQPGENPAPESPAPSSVDVVVSAVTAARHGLTVHEAARRLRWRQGQTSCALSRAEKRGRLTRTGFRDGCAVYVTAGN